MKKYLEALRKFKNILAIETSGLFCSVALKSNGKIKHKVTDKENEHGLVILDFIEDLLTQSDVKKESLDLARLKFGDSNLWNVKSNDGIAEAALLTLYWIEKFNSK